MKNSSSSCCRQCERDEQPLSERRKFLQGVAVAAGSLVLGLQTSTLAQDQAAQVPGGEEEFLLALPPQVLEKVGGAEVIETPTDKIIVARTGPTSIVACSAICTHKGCTVDYQHESKQFVCPCHGARYELTGKVVQGPARRDLKAYKTRPVLGLSAPGKKEVS